MRPPLREFSSCKQVAHALISRALTRGVLRPFDSAQGRLLAKDGATAVFSPAHDKSKA